MMEMPMVFLVCAVSCGRLAEELVRSRSNQTVVSRRYTQTSPFPRRKASRAQHALAHAGRGGVGSPGEIDRALRRVRPTGHLIWVGAECRCPGASRKRCRQPRDTPSEALRLGSGRRSEEHTSELQSPDQLVCRLLL